jgi:hypothetical protein
MTSRVRPAPDDAPRGQPLASSPIPLDDSLDALLRFTGDAAGAARLEAAFAASLARTMRTPVGLVFLGLAYAASFAVYATTATTETTDWFYLAVAGVSLALVPALRGPLWVSDLAVASGATLFPFAFDFDGDAAGMCRSGRYGETMLYIALPLVSGATFCVHWRLYAVMCVAQIQIQIQIQNILVTQVKPATSC